MFPRIESYNHRGFSMKLWERYRQRIYKYLKQHFKERGCNFYFKSVDIEKEVGIPTRIIGRICNEFTREGLLERWSGCRHGARWKTQFKGE